MPTAPSFMEKLNVGTWRTTPRKGSLDFPPRDGATISRNISQQRVTDCSYVTKLLTQVEKDALEEFYYVTLGSGALTFDMSDPDTETTKAFKFRSPPTSQIDGSTKRYRVTIELERIG